MACSGRFWPPVLRFLLMLVVVSLLLSLVFQDSLLKAGYSLLGVLVLAVLVVGPLYLLYRLFVWWKNRRQS